MTPTRKRFWRLLALGLLVCLLLAGRALAEPLAPTVDWWIVAAGGGPASAGSVSTDGTFGQPITGASGGGSVAVAVSAGYWVPLQAKYHAYLPALFQVAGGR